MFLCISTPRSSLPYFVLGNNYSNKLFFKHKQTIESTYMAWFKFVDFRLIVTHRWYAVSSVKPTLKQCNLVQQYCTICNYDYRVIY